MAENGLLGPAIVAVLGLGAILWLPSRIRGVCRGERSAPWLPIRTTDYFFFRTFKLFEVTDHNFPAFGTMLLCMGGFAFCLGASSLVGPLGFPGLAHPLVVLAVALLPVAFAFAFIALVIYWTGSPTFLVPPALREREGEPATGGERKADPKTASATEPREGETASHREGLLDPDGLLDRAVIVVIAGVTGFVVGVPMWLFALSISVGVGLAAGILAWLGIGAYLIRQRSLRAAISTAAYSIAVAIMSVSLIVFTPEWRADSTTALAVDFAGVAVLCAILAAIVAGVGVLAGRYIPEPGPGG